jgi:4'-phosphopantetheinyl transferase
MDSLWGEEGKMEIKLALQQVWIDLQNDVQLDDDSVHIWRANLDQDDRVMNDYLNLLSLDERERAGRFYFSLDRNRFVVRRGILRCLLSAYLHCAPERIKFEYSAFGKPSLVEQTDGGRVCFNLSHSNGKGLFVISRQDMLGIDIEFMRDDRDLLSIASAAFSTHELGQLRTLPENLQKEAFFSCWTRKEAFIKATGKGLSFPLKNFDVSLAPGDSVQILRVEGLPEESFAWQLEELPVEEGYKAALAIRIERKNLHIHLWNYPEPLFP